MKILIRSYKRADSVKTLRIIPDAVVVVPNSQKKEYEECNKKATIIGIDDKLDGNSARKFNAILDMYKGEKLVILDDDLIGIKKFENSEQFDIIGEEVRDIFLMLFCLMDGFNTILGGFNQQVDRKFYREYSPISLKSCVLGPVMAINNIDENIRFDENIFLKEDYDFNIQVLNKYRKVVRLNKYSYLTKFQKNKGGLMGIRNKSLELEHLKLLQRKWGSKIVKINRKTQNGNETINPIVKVPIKGI